ncbi:hypothetical protein QYF61_007465 [Mycteria americana]|uniref:Uncharacterized protein n=1 Tax=Mycteria americana TaxID=33587 RepID=A0AAN7RPD3_MYCAM|nr:hypothetical protein QYF61_007465 [Mycteria americana]
MMSNSFKLKEGRFRLDIRKKFFMMRVDMILMRNFNYPNTCWRDSTTGHKQSTRFLECTDDNFQTQVTEELMLGDDLLEDLMNVNKVKLIGDVKVRDNLNCSDHKMVAFSILRGANKANSKITAMDFRMATGHRTIEYAVVAQILERLNHFVQATRGVRFRVSKQFKNIIQRSAPRPDSYEWQGVWDSMGKYLSYWAPPVFWNFTPEQVLNPENLVEYLEKVCCHPGNSRETQITAMCWGLAHAYRALFNTIQNPQGSGDKTTGTAAAPAPPATGTAAASITPATGTVAAPAPAATSTAAAAALENSVTSTVVQTGNEPVSVSVAPTHKKKSWKCKSARLEREDQRAGPSQGEEEEDKGLVNETETTRSLSLSELRDMRKYFSRRPGEHIVTWLLRCWDSGASSLELEGTEAKQLGSLSREGGIDKAIGKGEPARSLWRRLLSAMKERYPFKEDAVYHPGKWTTMEKGIQYLRELAVLEVIYGDLDDVRSPTDPDEVQCTRPMWWKLVRNAPSSCANSLAILTWKDGDGPTVNEAASNLREYEESISSSLVSAVEKLSWKVQ